jgi:hypothetical protein
LAGKGEGWIAVGYGVSGLGYCWNLSGRKKMSYNVYLKDAITGQILELDSPHQMKGGTYCLGGTTEAALNITYNYSVHFHRVFPAKPSDHLCAENGMISGVRFIYGSSGADSISILKQAIAQLGDDINDDYWEPTEGNAKRSLMHLLALAQMRPDGVWDGD